MSNPLENLKAFLETEDGKKSIERFREKLRREHENHLKWVNHFTTYFNTLSNEEFQTFMVERFFPWENTLEEHYYNNRHSQRSSRIFYIIFKIATNFGVENSNTGDEDFLAGSFKYRGLDFNLYCGQGCFYRVEKDGENIFQSY